MFKMILIISKHNHFYKLKKKSPILNQVARKLKIIKMVMEILMLRIKRNQLSQELKSNKVNLMGKQKII